MEVGKDSMYVYHSICFIFVVRVSPDRVDCSLRGICTEVQYLPALIMDAERELGC